MKIGKRPVALFPRHILGDFDTCDLRVSSRLVGGKYATPLRSILRLTGTTEASIDGDIEGDLCIGTFPDHYRARDFAEYASLSDFNSERTIHGDRLACFGFLKQLTEIDGTNVKFGFIDFEVEDIGPFGPDPVMRSARGPFSHQGIDEITGISGGIVYNMSRNTCAGIVLRGGIVDGVATLHYIDGYDIKQILTSIRDDKDGTSEITYSKGVGGIVYVDPRTGSIFQTDAMGRLPMEVIGETLLAGRLDPKIDIVGTHFHDLILAGQRK